MHHHSAAAGKLSHVIITFLGTAILLTLGANKSVANDRDDAKELVGYWIVTSGMGGDIEFKADGTYAAGGHEGKWTVKGGKLVIHTILGDAKEDFTLSPDGNRLDCFGGSYKRKR